MLDRFEISLSRFNIIWLIAGAIIGRALGYVLGMDLGFWYFTDTGPLLGWQITLGIVSALFYSFMMTSKFPPYLKGAVLGAGLGFALMHYGGELRAMAPPEGSLPGLANLDVGSGIFTDWLYIHSTMVGGFIGLIIGYIITWRAAKSHSTSLSEEPSTAG